MSLLANMTPRERTLALVVGGVVFVLLNLVLLDFLIKRQARVRSDLAAKQAEWEGIQTLFNERDLWVKRDQWLTENLPKLVNESVAVVELRDFAKSLAGSHDIAFENSQLLPVVRSETATAVPVGAEIRGTWPAMIAFLHALQQPRHFIVLENASFEVDAADSSKLKAEVRLAKWYAPPQ